MNISINRIEGVGSNMAGKKFDAAKKHFDKKELKLTRTIKELESENFKLRLENEKLKLQNDQLGKELDTTKTKLTNAQKFIKETHDFTDDEIKSVYKAMNYLNLVQRQVNMFGQIVNKWEVLI